LVPLIADRLLWAPSPPLSLFLPPEDSFTFRKCLTQAMLAVLRWVDSHATQVLTLSLRDVISWIQFWNHFVGHHPSHAYSFESAIEGFFHGGCMLFVDGIAPSRRAMTLSLTTRGLPSVYGEAMEELLMWHTESLCHQFSENLPPQFFLHLKHACGIDGLQWIRNNFVSIEAKRSGEADIPSTYPVGAFRIPFVSSQATAALKDQSSLKASPLYGLPESSVYTYHAASTATNLGKILRGLQLEKAILLDGPPGVGKTSLVQALAAHTGNSLIRINLSEQTDMMDLLGSDVPFSSSSQTHQEGRTLSQFQWMDGVLVQAMKTGQWVLLDELNLAPQPVLEGLNALLDHRKEVYIPEMDTVVSCAPSFRLFASQNPSSESGGGRKMLPRSFLNRFTRIFVEDLSWEDCFCIASHLYGECIDTSLLQTLCCLLKEIQTLCETLPFEGHTQLKWNLRDLLKLCETVKLQIPTSDPSTSAALLIVSCLRTPTDRHAALLCISKHFSPSEETMNSTKEEDRVKVFLQESTQLVSDFTTLCRP
ncbi:hypothetical protein IE077_001877, partial [Cardiosporidium cionae]